MGFMSDKMKSLISFFKGNNIVIKRSLHNNTLYLVERRYRRSNNSLSFV